jgi:hypothetical protein
MQDKRKFISSEKAHSSKQINNNNDINSEVNSVIDLFLAKFD